MILLHAFLATQHLNLPGRRHIYLTISEVNSTPEQKCVSSAASGTRGEADCRLQGCRDSKVHTCIQHQQRVATMCGLLNSTCGVREAAAGSRYVVAEEKRHACLPRLLLCWRFRQHKVGYKTAHSPQRLNILMASSPQKSKHATGFRNEDLLEE